MNSTLEIKLKQLPDSPGVYLMHSKGEIIYVGKAVNLKNRVRQYFQSGKNHSAKVRAMVDKIDDFEIILCDTELEALVLECTLIKRHQPWYNILLKDGKHYPYIRIDVTQPYPRAEVVRSFQKDGAKYFGPYLGAGLIRDMLDALRITFPLRTCTRDLTKPSRPCVEYEINQCIAPCTGNVTPERYSLIVKDVISFLNGHSEGILDTLKAKMQEAAQAMNFERAAVYRDRLQAVDKVMQRQKAISTGGEDQDILAVASDGMDAIVQLLFMRGGKLIGSEPYTLEHVGDATAEELLGSFLLQYYDEAQFIPKEILLQARPQDSTALEGYLTQKKGGRVYLHVPERGEKRQLIEMARKNAFDALEKRNAKLLSDAARTTGALRALGEVLSIPTPNRIEAYDISHTQGVEVVASMVVSEEGMAKKSDYRRFKLHVQQNNDFESMAEIITRRFTRLKQGDTRFGARPDAVLIDGGPQQLAFALEAFARVGLEDDIPFFGLAERLEEIYLPGRPEPIRLPRTSEALLLLQRIRDEAHRFAITYHRSLRTKRSIASQLESIPGVGPKRRAALLKAFGSVAALKAATLEELQATPNVDKRSAQAVWDYFHAERVAP